MKTIRLKFPRDAQPGVNYSLCKVYWSPSMSDICPLTNDAPRQAWSVVNLKGFFFFSSCTRFLSWSLPKTWKQAFNVHRLQLMLQCLFIVRIFILRKKDSERFFLGKDMNLLSDKEKTRKTTLNSLWKY